MGAYGYIELSESEDEQLRGIEQSQHLKAKVRLRAQVIRLSNQQWTLRAIASYVGRSYCSVRRDLDRWRTRGMEGLADGEQSGKPRKLSDAALKYLQGLLGQDRDWNAQQLCDQLQQHMAIEVDDESMRRYLHELGYGWKRTRYVPAGQPKSEQLLAFQNRIEVLKKRLKRAR